MNREDEIKLYEIASFLKDLSEADRMPQPEIVKTYYDMLMGVLSHSVFSVYTHETDLLHEYEEYLSVLENKGKELHPSDLIRGFFIRNMNKKD